MSFLRMTDLPLRGRRILIREDLNVPLENGHITSTTRLEAALPALQLARDSGARTLVMSHLGRPKEGLYDNGASLAPVANWLSQALGQPVRLIKDWVDGVELGEGEVALAENVRFNVGEKSNDEALSKRMAAACDIYVMDAFATAHRAQASTHGVARYAPVACAGPLLAAELDALGRALKAPARPLVAIVAGSKVSTKLELLTELIAKVDTLIVGGGIANTFLAAQGYAVGQSLHEPDLLGVATEVMGAAQQRGVQLPLPIDVVTAPAFAADAQPSVVAVDAVDSGQMILDIGPASAAAYAEHLAAAGTIVWNGPVGVFEFDNFAGGTKAMAKAVAASPAFSIAGGGDTLAAIEKFAVGDEIDYISTGGGAFLEFLEGKVLPAVEILNERANRGA